MCSLGKLAESLIHKMYVDIPFEKMYFDQKSKSLTPCFHFLHLGEVYYTPRNTVNHCHD